MSRLDREMHGAQPRRLLELSRDALRRASAGPPVDIGAQLGLQLGLLSQVLQAVETHLAVVEHRLARSSVLHSVDGPFADDPGEAREVAVRWLARARAESTATRDSVDSAHIAAAGLVRHPAS